MTEQDILDLLIKEHYGLITPEEQAVLDHLLATSELARKVKEKARFASKEEARAFIDKVDDAATTEELNDRYVASLQSGRSKSMWLLRIAVAAIAVGFAVGVILWWQHRQPDTSAFVPLNIELSREYPSLILKDGRVFPIQQGSNAEGIFSIQQRGDKWYVVMDKNLPESHYSIRVPVKLTCNVVLPDSSSVQINSETIFQFNTEESAIRKAFVRGEAYFDIVHNASKPFLVDAGNSTVEVLGTSFNVNTYDSSRVRVALDHGKIALLANRQRKELSPGQEAEISDSGIHVRPFEQHVEMGWRNNEYVFEGEPIREVMAMVYRKFGVTVNIDSQEAGDLVIRGKVFTDRPLKELIDDLQGQGKLEFYQKDGVYHCKLR